MLRATGLPYQLCSDGLNLETVRLKVWMREDDNAAAAAVVIGAPSRDRWTRRFIYVAPL